LQSSGQITNRNVVASHLLANDQSTHRFVSRLASASLIRSHARTVGYRQLGVNKSTKRFFGAGFSGKKLLPALGGLFAAGHRPLG
jgi:hypothetical protein